MSKTVLTTEAVQKIAKLANLSLTSEELGQYTQQLESIFEYFEILNTIDTSTLKPTYQVNNLKNQLRSDVVKPSMQLDGYILAPKTIHKE